MAISSFQVFTKVIHGAGRRNVIPNEVNAIGGTKVLLVSDEGLKKAGIVDLVAKPLQDANIPFIEFTNVEEDPSTLTVAKGVEYAKAYNPDVLVICGGGSAICAGKGIALVLSNGGKLDDYAVGTHKVPPLPMIVLPTTAGSGAEVAPRFLIKDPETDVKRRFGGNNCYPRVAILDPELLLRLPPRAAVGASMDALCHAIEAYTATEANEFTDTLALKAIGNLKRYTGAAAFTNSLEAREKVLIASTMANMACGNAKLGLVHGLTYGHLPVPHGMANGIILPYVLNYLLPACEEKLAEIAAVMGIPSTGYVYGDAKRLIEVIQEWSKGLGVPANLKEIGVKEEELEELVNVSMKQVQHLDTSLRPAKRKDIEEIFRHAYFGE